MSRSPSGAAACVLIYEYVEGMLERRVPYRDAHLELVRQSAEGGLAIAGATGDPPDGAIFVFESGSGDPARLAEAFRDADPYVEAGLVTSARIAPWTIVVSRPLARDSGN